MDLGLLRGADPQCLGRVDCARGLGGFGGLSLHVLLREQPIQDTDRAVRRGQRQLRVPSGYLEIMFSFLGALILKKQQKLEFLPGFQVQHRFIFEGNLRRIGSMVALLDTWNSPVYLTRASGIFVGVSCSSYVGCLRFPF